MGIIEVWTLIAIVLHCCDVKYFANLPIIDWPWNWSCLCLENMALLRLHSHRSSMGISPR